jgi:S-adenosylmethionine synthetase
MKKSSKEYKPILVFYFSEIDNQAMSDLSKSVNETAKKFGYDNVFMFFDASTQSRVEIISVDKATVVEDVQKYIDSKVVKSEFPEDRNTKNISL